jgi:hypothetical protein
MLLASLKYQNLKGNKEIYVCDKRFNNSFQLETIITLIKPVGIGVLVNISGNLVDQIIE